MASEESSSQTVVEPAISNPKPEAESKAGDDPEESIQKILGIVETLHNFFPSQKGTQQGTEGRRSKSMNPATTTEAVSATLNKTKSDTTGSKAEETENSIPKLQRNLRLLKEDVGKLKELLNEEVAEEVKRHIQPLDKLLEKVKADSSKTKLTKGMKKDLEDVNKKIFNLMCQVPLLPNKRRKHKGLDDDAGDEVNNGKGIECLHGIHANKEDLKKREVFRYVQGEFVKLSPDRMICLLSFAVFPENQEVNRTMLMYWWIGEGILPIEVKPPRKGDLADEEKPENIVKEILKEFTDKKLIEPVENKRKVEPNSYKMTPFVHSSVVLISKELELFDIYEDKTKPKMKQSELNRVCLVDGSSSQPEAKAKKMEKADEIETVLNVSERFPDFAFKWFSEEQASGKKKKTLSRFSNTTYKNLKVFYLGRWERTAKRHIEVENPELMKNLKHMTKLRLLSLQGISRIERLDDAVCKLRELIILDVRACYNLEKLPDKIDKLKKLIYLDITDCYMIDRMPKKLSWLNNLEVLKGFVVSDATDEETFCALAELEHLKKLRKLSITINKGGDFTVRKLFSDIGRLLSLEKLKVAWGGINEHTIQPTTGGAVQRLVRTVTGRSKSEIAADQKHTPKLPEKLKKLDLQCFPDAELPKWLQPRNLGGLEKLYIKGGTELTGFGKVLPEKPTDCKVKVLRLKFLPRLKVEWRELSQLYFPELEYLDKYQCPQVSFCPCDGIGIWRKEPQVRSTHN